MHARFFEGLLLATLGDVRTQDVSPKLSKQFAAILDIPDTGCTHWLKLAEHREQWTALVRDCNRRLILHPQAAQQPATAECEFYTESAPSAVELAFNVAEGVLDHCSAELARHQAGEITDEQLNVSISKSIPAFDPNDAAEVFARLQREWVILAETDDRETTAEPAELVELSEIVLPPNEQVAEIHKTLMAQPENKRNVRATCKEIADRYPHLKLKHESLRVQYNTWLRNARQ